MDYIQYYESIINLYTFPFNEFFNYSIILRIFVYWTAINIFLDNFIEKIWEVLHISFYYVCIQDWEKPDTMHNLFTNLHKPLCDEFLHFNLAIFTWRWKKVHF